MQNTNKILKKQIEIIKPKKETLDKIKKITKEFCEDLRKKLGGKKIKAEVFVGGSLAKNTLVKKDRYDVDVFVRFDKKYDNDKISKFLGRVLGRKAKKIHGSRDYYQLVVDDILIEVIPVMKIKKPIEAQNITDLSYFHVNYILKKIRKNKKLSDEIMLAKTFVYAQNCYGAESYIHGFSGYALELLVCHYGSFLKFIKTVYLQNIKQNKRGSIYKSWMRKADYINNKNKIIIDDSKFYKNRAEILRELNESKLNSPIILIDPTFNERNALAGLSQETFLKFKKACSGFLKNSSEKFFEKKDVFEVLNKKYGKELRIISIKTNKQAGDIAGTKSKKFFRFFKGKLKREFEVKKDEFYYDEDKNVAHFYFVLEKKKDEIVKGPHVTKVVDLGRFKKAHSKAFIKNHIAYAKVRHSLSFEKFFGWFNRKYKKVLKEMGVEGMELVKN